MTGDAITENLGDRIARLRRSKGWNQRELGEKLGLSAAQVSKLERGSYVPRAQTIVQLSTILDVSTDFLLSGHSFGEPQKDYRFRERLELLESLPEPQRNHLVSFLDALISAHQLLRRCQDLGEQRRAKEAAERASRRVFPRLASSTSS